MAQPAIYDVLDAPVTCITMLICAVSWFMTWNKRVPHDVYCYNYEKIKAGEWWRMITSTYSHANLMHLAFNLSSLWNLRFLEVDAMHYCRLTFLLIIFSELAITLLYYVAINVFAKEQYRHVNSVGYSCVLFGLITFAAVKGYGFSFFGVGRSLPAILQPFIMLGITQLIVPRASFLGHLAGIIAGYPIAYFDSSLAVAFNNYVFFVSLGIASVMCLWSIRGFPNVRQLSVYRMYDIISGSENGNSGVQGVAIQDGLIVRQNSSNSNGREMCEP
eukprot:180547_1